MNAPYLDVAIDDRFFRYLDHVRPRHTVGELADDRGLSGAALRHDVDHDLDLALEMAYWEHDRGVRASYYLLHTAPYWDRPDLEAACRQLEAFGHEVGLHVNVMAQWATGGTDDPEAELGSALTRLRSSGVEVSGTAAHGDPACYARGVSNYWCFRELRGDDPRSSEQGLSAEGVPSPDPRFRLTYPDDHQVRRPDGSTLPLWQTAMAGHGLRYEAVKVPVDGYYTDSGGSWSRSPDPLDVSFGSGRQQVLVHPEYWRGPQRLYLFLSTARSGSTWLAKVLDAASSVTARHELSLNHRYQDGELVADKRTGPGFRQLLDEPQEVRSLLADVRTWMEDVPGDVAEANVYLAHVPEQVADVFPDATLVHLVRDPRRVVPSLLARDWYDTPEDDRHPTVDVPGWAQMSQLEQVCWYVRDTTERLAQLASSRVVLEDVTADRVRLSAVLRRLGIAFYPELSTAFDQVVNPGRVSTERGYAALPGRDRRRFDAILSPLRQELGYERTTLRTRLRDAARRARPAPPAAPAAPAARTVLASVDCAAAPEQISSSGYTAPTVQDGRVVMVPAGDRHAHVLLGGGTWKRLRDGQGWPATVGGYFRLELSARAETGEARVFCLMYDADGTQVDKRLLSPLAPDGRTRCTFRTRANAARFDLAVYSPVTALPARLELDGFRLELEAATPTA